MWSKFISQGAREIIYEQLIAEMIFSLPINSMCLEGIAAVWAKENDTPSGFEDANHFVDGGAVTLYVFDHFVAENQVKGPGRKREEFSGGVEDIRRVCPRFGGALKVIFQSDDCSAERGEVFDVHSHTASIFQYFAFNSFTCILDDHIESALLSRPPNIRRFTA